MPAVKTRTGDAVSWPGFHFRHPGLLAGIRFPVSVSMNHILWQKISEAERVIKATVSNIHDGRFWNMPGRTVRHISMVLLR